jgi:hypothetical protein
MTIDISKEKEELIKSVKLIIFVYNNLFLSILIPIIPIYAEILFIKSVKKLNEKLKNLNINLYDSLFYLADHKKLALLLVLFSYFAFPFISFILSPFISIFLFFIDLFYKKNVTDFLFITFVILSFAVLILPPIYFFISFFLVSKYKSNISKFCQGLYELTGNEEFNRCAIHFLNAPLDKGKNTKALNTIYTHKEPFENLYKLLIQKIPNEINIIEITAEK